MAEGQYIFYCVLCCITKKNYKEHQVAYSVVAAQSLLVITTISGADIPKD